MMLQEREVKASTRAGLKLEEEWAEHHRREQREMEIINRQYTPKVSFRSSL